MTLVEDLMVKASEYLPQDKINSIEEAYRFAEAAHVGQVRKSGEPFIEHPLNTALYLADLKLDSTALSAALLHDVMEDCGVPIETISERFGSDVAKLVDGVTKLTKTELQIEDADPNLITNTDAGAQAANIRKMLMSMAEDIRVVLIMLADRVHNLRPLKALPT